MDITLDSLATLLNTHSFMFAGDIQTKTRLGLELESQLKQRQAAGEYYVVENAESSEVLQPYQGTFTPKGSLTHSEQKIRIRPIKMDLEFTEVDLEKWWNSWMIDRFDPEKDPMNWTFPRYIVEKEIIPKFNDDLNNVGWNGSYAAPTPGTAGDAVNAVDGYKKVIADLITAGAIPAGNVYASATVTASNIRETVEAFLDSIPEHITKKGGVIKMCPKHRRWYFRDYRSEFTSQIGPYPQEGGPKKVEVDDYNVMLESVATMTGSDRWIFLPNGRDNMVWVSRVGAPVYPQMIWKTKSRVLEMYATIYRGYGFEYPQEVYVNDQV